MVSTWSSEAVVEAAEELVQLLCLVNTAGGQAAGVVLSGDLAYPHVR